MNPPALAYELGLLIRSGQPITPYHVANP